MHTPDPPGRKVLRVPANWFLDLFARSRTHVCLPVFDPEDVPPGARVVSVTGNWYSGTIDLLVEHESIPPVADGERYPDFLANEWMVVQIDPRVGQTEAKTMWQIALLLLNLFGPILAEAVKRWLENRLKRAAESLPDPKWYDNKAAATAALLDEALAQTRWYEFVGRRRLRRMKALAIQDGELVQSLPPTAAELLK